MSPTLDAFLRSWPLDPWLLAGLLVAAGVYLRGWLVLKRRDPKAWHGGFLVVFLSGLAAIYLALASPIEPFAGLLLQVHMVQHLLLMMVAPPLLWLGAPLLPLLLGLPRPVRIYWAAPLLTWKPLRRLFVRLTFPLTALPLFIAITWIWHLPPIYDLALRLRPWHYLQHFCFLSAALLFWYPVVRPYPSRPSWSPWLLIPYLLVADLSNTVLSAVLTFSDRVLYSHYESGPRLAGLSAVDDQSLAGLIMWVPGSMAFLLPLFGIGVRLLSGEISRARERTPPPNPLPEAERGGRNNLAPLSLVLRGEGLGVRGSATERSRTKDNASPTFPQRFSLPLVTAPGPDSKPRSPGFDLLRLPLLGRFLKWRHARVCLQLPLLLLAGLIIYDGFCGPQVGSMNLAGVLPWIHWRGLVILGLLVAGNVFCMGCPFLLPRTIARRVLHGAGWNWPRRLRSKWLAVLLLAGFLWAYEALALWDRPWWTACLALGYFVGAFVVDSIFQGASFCKYLCPIGQFNFVQSLASPLEIKARDPAVCSSCQTRDCIRGRDGIPGCELNLFIPTKSGNMDCTTCLDCVHACPHDNVGLIAGPPMQRSGIARFGRRPDVAALIILLVFGAFANAAGMVGPVAECQEWLAETLGIPSLLATTSFYLLALLVLPILALGGSSALSRRWGRSPASTLEVATRYAYTLVPLGFGMWLAHYCFHFLTSYETAIPATQRFATALGITSFGEPEWGLACCRPMTPWLLPLEILFLDVGMLLSLHTAYRLALAESPRPVRALAPWALLLVLLFSVGIWILFQPMEMRGTLS